MPRMQISGIWRPQREVMVGQVAVCLVVAEGVVEGVVEEQVVVHPCLQRQILR